MEKIIEPITLSEDSLTTEDEGFNTSEVRDIARKNVIKEYDSVPDQLNLRKKRNIREELRLKRELDALKAENATK